MVKNRKIIYVAPVLIILAILLWWALKPAPVAVETARASRGAMQVSIDADGKTRIHDRFVLAAPVSGRMRRIDLHRGDEVNQGDQITVIEPLPVQPLDPRQFAEATAKVSASQSILKEALALVERVRTECDQARRERLRAEKLLETGDISKQDFERARNTENACRRELEAAQFKSAAASSEVEIAKSALIQFQQQQKSTSSSPVPVKSPLKGTVLKLIEESERVVMAGSPLLELSNPSHLEIVIDVLSTDAVRILPGMAALLENWGGDHPLPASVRMIEPSAFTKVSALGVEEQRVNVIADFTEGSGSLGDGYRIEARIITWQADSVLQIPTSALFRKGEAWSVFIVENGKISNREIEIGHRNPSVVEVIKGLDDGAVVVLHPTNQLADGTNVRAR